MDTFAINIFASFEKFEEEKRKTSYDLWTNSVSLES